MEVGMIEIFLALIWNYRRSHVTGDQLEWFVPRPAQRRSAGGRVHCACNVVPVCKIAACGDGTSDRSNLLILDISW